MTAEVDTFDLYAFDFLGRRLRFAWESHAPDAVPLIEFVDDDHARSFLHAITRDPHVYTVLEMVRRQCPFGLGSTAFEPPMAFDPPTVHDPPRLERSRLIEALARHLANKTLLLVDGYGAKQGGGGRVKPVEPPKSKPPPKVTESTFIAIELVDEEGIAVPFERYRITLPDGTERSGRLDDKGKARIENIRPAGACDITFVDLHGEEWRSDG